MLMSCALVRKYGTTQSVKAELEEESGPWLSEIEIKT